LKIENKKGKEIRFSGESNEEFNFKELIHIHKPDKPDKPEITKNKN